MRVAFIGLGVMGFPMAGHLQQAGHQVTVYNRNTEKARLWEDRYHGQTAESPKQAVESAELVMCCVGDDDSVRDVVLGSKGALSGMAQGRVFVDHTTASAELARELHQQCAASGVGFLDAPVSGGQAGAEHGQLTVMVGGEPSHFAMAQPLINCYAKSARLMGPAGAGQLTKMVNQICIAGLVQSLAEGIHFAKQAGLDTSAVMDVISKGAAQSWQMENRHASMSAGEYDHGFAVDWMRKDLNIALTEARRCNARLPVAALVDQFYAQIQAIGGQRWDTSSLLALLEQ